MRIDGKEIPILDKAFSKEELKCLKEVMDKPIIYDDESPETTPEMAKKFRRVNPEKAAVNDS